MTLFIHPTRLALTVVLAAAVGAAGSARADAGTQIDLRGVLKYPAPVPGNEDSAGSEFHSGFVAGSSQSGSQALTASGAADGNGTSGSTSFVAMATAELGTLHAVASSNVSSTGNPQGYFPHGDGQAYANAQFWDTVTVYDPTLALGATLTAAIGIQLDWQGVFGGASPFFFGQAGAQANFGLTNGGGNVSVQTFRRSDLTKPYYLADDPLSIKFQNGQTVDVSGSLTINAESSVAGYTTDGVSAYATSDAGNTAHFFFSGAPTLTVVGLSGHDYTTSAVPEAASAWLLVMGGAALGLWRRRARPTSSR